MPRTLSRTGKSAARAVAISTAFLAAATSAAYATVDGTTGQAPELQPASLAPPEIELKGWNSLPLAELTPDRLIGAPLFDPDNKRIGEIENVVVTGDGTLTATVLGVGGFLGVGEKDVLVSADSLKLLLDPEESEIRVYAGVSKDKLKDLPEFEM